MLTPAYRYLRGYALDPGFSTRLDTVGMNSALYRVRFETLARGPVGEYVEVVDFDPASGCWYDPVDLSDERVAAQQGLHPSEGDPQFHQQFVYTVAMKTIAHFERALGRKVIWRTQRRESTATGGSKSELEYVQRLRIHPHAIRDANAYYDPGRVALLFGYFSAADQLVGSNYPGGIVFTCLSPDIIAHEVAHALLDSVHHRYMEDTNKDVGAFHEGFADIVALLSRFTFRELVEQQLFASAGRMDRYTLFGELATQFGEAIEGYRGALRSAIGEWTDEGWKARKPEPSDYGSLVEAHDLGALLVATVFDAFQRVYQYRTADLLRIATNGTGRLPEGSISHDLVRRLAAEAADIAEHLLHICIRALDYCPPVDITFGNYLRALVTADMDIAPEDEQGYRVALIEAFRARGIFPDRVRTMSPESLRWAPPRLHKEEAAFFRRNLRQLGENIRKLASANDREMIHDLSKKLQGTWQTMLMAKVKSDEKDLRERFLNEMGLTGAPVKDLFGKGSAKKHGLRFLDHRGKVLGENAVVPIEVHAIRPVFRAGREGRQIEQVLIMATQTVRVELKGHRGENAVVFRGGSTLILPMNGLDDDKDYNIELAVLKNVRSWERFQKQLRYMDHGDEARLHARSTYAGTGHSRTISLSKLHQH